MEVKIFIIFEATFYQIMRRIIFINLYLLLFVAVSCKNNDNIVTKSLDLATVLMQTKPDSALVILHSLNDFYELEGANRACFALLYNEALELNLMAHPHDSIIYDAIDYYGSVKDYRKLGKSWYYLGKALVEIDSITPAMYAFLKAKDALQQFEDDDFLGLVTNEMAALYHDQHQNGEALSLYRQSLALSQKAGNRKSEGYVLLRIADLFYISDGSADSVQTYLDRAKEIAIERNDSEFLYTVLTTEAIAHKEYAEAKQILFSSIHKFKQGIPSVECYSLLGTLYYDLEQIDSARYYKQLVLRDPQSNAKLRISALSLLKEIEQHAGDYVAALKYATLFQELSDSILQSRHAYNLAFAIQKYQLDRVIGETSLQRARFIAAVTVFVVVVITGIFAARFFRKKYVQKIIQQEEIAKEYVRTSLLNGWNYALFEEKFKDDHVDLTTDTDMAKVTKLADRAYPGLSEWLNNKFPLLSENERALTYLLFTGLDPKDLCAPFKVPDCRAMYTRCSRLYNKLGVKTTPKDQFSFRYRIIDLYVEDILP